jgi:hypothetical protein
MYFESTTWLTLFLGFLLAIVASFFYFIKNNCEKSSTPKKEEQQIETYATKSEAELEVGKDFFVSQLEREKIIADKTSVFFSDRVRRPLSKKNLEYTDEETKLEDEQRKQQLDYIHSLLKKQEEVQEILKSDLKKAASELKTITPSTNLNGNGSSGCPYMRNNNCSSSVFLDSIGSMDEQSDYKFSVLNEDGLYEEVPNENSFRDKFTSQMRLYGL